MILHDLVVYVTSERYLSSNMLSIYYVIHILYYILFDFGPPKSFSLRKFLLAIRKVVNKLEDYSILEGAAFLQNVQAAVTLKSEI